MSLLKFHRSMPWRILLVVVALAFLGYAAEADDPIILPPSSANTDQTKPDIVILPSPSTPTPEPSQSDPIPIPPSSLSPSSLLPPPPPVLPILPLPPYHTSPPQSSPLHNASPYQSSSSTPAVNSKPLKHDAKPPSPQPPRPAPYNKAASSLKLVHVPLKVSCDILRQFYNSTGGTNWSNQDGWQYVDSVTIPSVSPRAAGASDGSSNTGMTLKPERRYSHDNNGSKQRFSAHLSPHSVKERTIPAPVSNPAGPIGTTSGEGKTVPFESSIASADNLDPNNCCGWYGVVCIGPDGVIPAPWPPYDDDLIVSTRPSVSARDLRSDFYVLPLKKRAGPYYNHHNRNQHHHPKDGGDGRGRGGNGGGGKGGGSSETGGSDNRHRPDDGNNEDGKPSADPSGDGGDSQDSEHDDNSQILPPSTDYGRSGGVGNRIVDVDDWYIIELHLGFNGLTGPVPEELSDLVNLMILDISNNELTGQIPDSYGNLTRLRRFDISSNQITGAFPAAVTKMMNVQELVLKNNYLTGSLPAEVLKLKQLTELSIANNEFDGMLPPGLFSSLTKLRVININQNGFSGELGAEIGALTGLLKFSARANEFRGRIPKELGNCKLLQSTNLGDNHFVGDIPESIYSLQNLRVLDIPANKLSGPISPKIGSMVSLTRLILSHNEFTGPLPIEIQNLTRMEYMVVNYNKFDGLFPIAVAPPLITVCLVQPNEFSSCPPNSSLETSTTLAYQCNLDCRDRVIHPEIYDAISRARPQHAMWGNDFGLSLSMVLFAMSLFQVL